MVYRPNKPQRSDRPRKSQAEIQENFQDINTFFDEDHVTFNAAENNGKHDHITYIKKIGAAPDPSTPADQGKTYTKGSKTDLYYRYPSDGIIIPLTFLRCAVSYIINTTSPFSVTIYKSYNVSSISQDGAFHRINFTLPFSDTNYFYIKEISTTGLIISKNVNYLKAQSSAGRTYKFLILGD